jgi:RNA-directed DNA polymerase
MSDASTLGNMSPELLKVVERARREPEGRFQSLAHLIDVPALERAYRRMRKDAAVGVDGVTKEAYGQNLEANLGDLHERLRTKRYRDQPIRRVHIPKGQGKTRPIGIAAVEEVSKHAYEGLVMARTKSAMRSSSWRSCRVNHSP